MSLDWGLIQQMATLPILGVPAVAVVAALLALIVALTRWHPNTHPMRPEPHVEALRAPERLSSTEAHARLTRQLIEHVERSIES